MPSTATRAVSVPRQHAGLRGPASPRDFRDRQPTPARNDQRANLLSGSSKPRSPSLKVPAETAALDGHPRPSNPRDEKG